MGQRQADKTGRRNNAAQKVVRGTATQSCSTSTTTSASTNPKLSADENKSPFSTTIGWVTHFVKKVNFFNKSSWKFFCLLWHHNFTFFFLLFCFMFSAFFCCTLLFFTFSYEQCVGDGVRAKFLNVYRLWSSKFFIDCCGYYWYNKDLSEGSRTLQRVKFENHWSRGSNLEHFLKISYENHL